MQHSPVGGNRGLLEPVGPLSPGESDDGGSGKSGKDDGEPFQKILSIFSIFTARCNRKKIRKSSSLDINFLKNVQNHQY